MSDYQPWTIETRVYVDLEWAGQPTRLYLPWVAAQDATAFAITAALVARLNLSRLWRLQEGEKQEIESQPEQQGEKKAALTPGLYRFGCSECKQSWDTWVGADGKLEDQRDAVCTTERCSRRGQPADKISEPEVG